MLCHSAVQLSDEEGAALEARVLANSDDLEARVKLVGFYFLKESEQPRRGEHLLWLAQHQPEIELGGYGSLVEEVAPTVYPAVLAAWRAAASDPRASVAVLGNAALFISLCNDQPEAIALYRRAAALEPQNGDWRKEIAWQLLRLADRAEGSERRALADEAACELGIALTVTSDASRQLALRKHVVRAFVLAERWDEVVNSAEQILVDNEADRASWNYGNLVHDANTALGFAALARGDVAAAGEYLVRAGKTPGSPQLNSFGPDYDLARALLRAGDRASVRGYLESCRRFVGHKEQIDRWLVDIEAGETKLTTSDD